MGLDGFIKSILLVLPRVECSVCYIRRIHLILSKAYAQSNIGSSVSVWDRIPCDITFSHMRLGTETGQHRSEFQSNRWASKVTLFALSSKA